MALVATAPCKKTHRDIHGEGAYFEQDLAVDGATELDGAVTMNSTLAVTGATTLTGDTALTGRLTTTDGVASGTAKVVGGRAANIVAAGTAHTGSTDEAVLASYTIPANTIKQGTAIRLRYQGIVTAETGATTLTVRVRLGATTLTGTALVTTSAVDADVSYIFTGEVIVVGRAAPAASAAVVSTAMYNDPGAAGAAMKAAFVASTNLATNAALLLELTADWSAADANSCRADIFLVEIL